MGKLSRTKGAAFECRVARWLTKLTGALHRRVLVETQQGNMGDVDCAEIAWVFQCKIGKRPPIWKAVAEAEEAAETRSETGEFVYGVAAIHRDGGEQVVAMRPETFAHLLCGHIEEGW